MTCPLKVLVTGAGGFIGKHLTSALLKAGYEVCGAVRHDRPPLFDHHRYSQSAVGDIGPDTDWAPALDGVRAVAHLAARVHVMKEDSHNPEELYRRINLLGTVNLAETSAKSGVERFIYASTVKVHGSERIEPYAEEETPKPEDAYGRSKYEAEKALFSMNGFSCAAIRPPLVYGPGVKGNFRALLNLVLKGLPLPFGLVRNKRSMVHVHNLTSAIVHLLSGPSHEGPFLIRDGRDLSTAELVRLMGRGLGRPARLLPVPPALLRAAGYAAGKNSMVERLLGDLRVDDSRLRISGWTPKIDAESGIIETATWYKQSRGNS